VQNSQQQLLRLLQLPAVYNPKTLPEGLQLLLPPSPAQHHNDKAAARFTPSKEGVGPQADDSGFAPVHRAVEKDGVRLQVTGEAVYAGDVAARMRGRVLHIAGVAEQSLHCIIQAVPYNGT
jgi:hypothetical protein